MRKIQVYLGILVAIILVSSSCSSRSYKGRVELSDSAKTWFPYKGGEKLVFKEANGDSASFTAGTLQEGSVAKIVECHEALFVGTNCDQYDLANEKLTFTGLNGLAFQYYLSVDKVNATKWDLLKVSLLEDKIEQASAITEVSGNGVPHSTVDFNYTDTLQMNGKKFGQVHSSTQNAGYTVYFNQKQGIVAFKLPSGQKWALQ